MSEMLKLVPLIWRGGSSVMQIPTTELSLQ